MPTVSDAIVIGGGFGGIAASLRLRAKGYNVTVIERCRRLGGRAQVFEKMGFRHDAGPTVLTAPFLFDELFELFGRRREDYVRFVPLTPWYRFWFSDGQTFDYGGSIEDTLTEIRRFNEKDMAGYQQLLDQSRKIFNIAFTQLADQPFHSVPMMLKQLPDLLRLGCYRTVWQLVSRHIQDPRLRQAFSIQPLLLGGNPFDTTSIYSLIHYLERKWGVHFAMGGTGAIVDALARLMQEVDIDIQLNTTVRRILTSKGTVNGIELENGERLSSPIIVANTDPLHLYQRMLRPQQQSKFVRLKQRLAKLSMGLFVLYFGTKRKYPEIAHHTIWLGKRYRELLNEIFRGSALPKDFSLYLHRPTATDTNFAPPSCDSFYVLAPVPNLSAGIDWETAGPKLQQRIVSALSQTLLPDLEQYITADFFMTPEDFAQDYLSVAGAGFSVAPLFRQSAWFRFHNRAEGPKNLFLVGAGTHPGAGLPGVLSSAKVIDRLVPATKPGLPLMAAS